LQALRVTAAQVPIAALAIGGVDCVNLTAALTGDKPGIACGY
jgi:hypothetical protein